MVLHRPVEPARLTRQVELDWWRDYFRLSVPHFPTDFHGSLCPGITLKVCACKD